MAKIERLEDQVEYKVKMNRKIIHKGEIAFQENLGSLLHLDIESKVNNAAYNQPDFNALECKELNFLRNHMGIDSYFPQVGMSFFKNGNKKVLDFVLDDSLKKLRFKCIFTAKTKVFRTRIPRFKFIFTAKPAFIGGLFGV